MRDLEVKDIVIDRTAEDFETQYVLICGFCKRKDVYVISPDGNNLEFAWESPYDEQRPIVQEFQDNDINFVLFWDPSDNGTSLESDIKTDQDVVNYAVSQKGWRVTRPLNRDDVITCHHCVQALKRFRVVLADS